MGKYLKNCPILVYFIPYVICKGHDFGIERKLHVYKETYINFIFNFSFATGFPKEALSELTLKSTLFVKQ
jgi:hypothetical protein